MVCQINLKHRIASRGIKENNQSQSPSTYNREPHSSSRIIRSILDLPDLPDRPGILLVKPLQRLQDITSTEQLLGGSDILEALEGFDKQDARTIR